MHKPIAAVYLLTLCPLAYAAGRKPVPNAPFPQSLIVGRHTFLDCCGPNDFYEIFSIQPGEGGLSVERLTVTPAGSPCTRPASVETATGTLKGSLSDLLVGANPCSMLNAQSQKPRVAPTVEILGSPSVRPVSFALPGYPPLARLANVEGDVTFQVNVAADGTVSTFTVVAGVPLLRPTVEAEVKKWKFSPEAAGQTVEFVVRFRTNCPAARQP